MFSQVTMAKPARRTKRRVAFTLVEVLLIVTIFTFLLSGIAVAMGTLLRAKEQLQDDLVRSSVLSRFAVQLRQDGHRADSAEKPDEATIAFRVQQVQIKYVVEPNRIVRTVAEGEQTRHHEVYSLANKTSIRWGISDTKPAVLSTVIEYESEKETQGSEIDLVDVVIGLHREPLP